MHVRFRHSCKFSFLFASASFHLCLSVAPGVCIYSHQLSAFVLVLFIMGPFTLVKIYGLNVG